MGLLDFFRKTPEMSVDEVRDFVDGHERDALNLVDVRTPKEYDQGHLPGAVLIPIAELPERTRELEPSRTTIAYCAAGGRSRAAVSVLTRAGFEDVYSMAGGMRAWQGEVSDVRPEVGTAWFAGAEDLSQTLALGYLLEEATKEFYERLARLLSRDAAAAMFAGMAATEGGHCDMLRKLYRQVSGDEEAQGFPYSVLHQSPGAHVVEGGMRLEDAIAWARGRKPWEVLEYVAGMEANAYDIYLYATRNAEDDETRQVFEALAEAEKAHLDEVSDRLAGSA
jgi:rhodanese-related sulfurtransferase/rubrerythrin